MKINPRPRIDGPIPGENWTSDARNYPWHRPPQFTDYDEAAEFLMGRLGETREIDLLYSLVKLEVPVYLITSNFLLRHIMRGYVAIDLAVLLAGPVSRYIQILAEDNGLKPDMSTEDPNYETITPTTLKLQLGQISGLKDLVEDDADEAADDDAMGGLMATPQEGTVDVATDDEQAAMLGYAIDQEELN